MVLIRVYPRKSAAKFLTRNLKLETRNCILPIRGAVAQFGRAPRSQCGGQGFDPPLLHQHSWYHIFSPLVLLLYLCWSQVCGQFFWAGLKHPLNTKSLRRASMVMVPT